MQIHALARGLALHADALKVVPHIVMIGNGDVVDAADDLHIDGSSLAVVGVDEEGVFEVEIAADTVGTGGELSLIHIS